MDTCLCSMAGTRACDTCKKGPSMYEPGWVFPSYYEPKESTEAMVLRLIKEAIDDLDTNV